MPRIGATHVARPDEGGLVRDPATIFGHRMPGAADLELLRSAVRLEATAHFRDDDLEVGVTITNDRTGHHVPTGSPLRHLILRLEARGPDGRSLVQRSGPVLPDWTGIGDPGEGNYAGLPGKAFAKVLRESWTGISPSASYWSPTRIVSDNRIAALATDASSYRFAAPPEGSARVEVVLLFRRAFAEIARRKGWPAADVVMARDRLDVQRSGDLVRR